MVGDVGVERVWVGGSAVGWSSSAFTVERRRVLGSGRGERAKGRVKSNPGILVVLRRAKERELGLWFGLSTATSRWRPAGSLGARGTGWRGPARSQRAVEEVRATRGRQSDGKRRPGSLSTAPASVPSVGGGGKQSREGEMVIRVDL